MTDSSDFRLYLEERFNGIVTLMNARFISVHDKLESIEEQTKKTNGTVIDHEKIIRANLPHGEVNCVQSGKITKIEENMVTKQDLIDERKYKNNNFKKNIAIVISGSALFITILTAWVIPGCERSQMRKMDMVIMDSLRAQTKRGINSTRSIQYAGDTTQNIDTLPK